MSAVIGALILLFPLVSPGSASTVTVRPVALLTTGGPSWAFGEHGNLLLAGGGLTLAGDASFVREGRPFGLYVSPAELVAAPFDLVQAQVAFEGQPDGLLLEARTSADQERWSAWSELPLDGAATSVPPGRFFQYRVELRAGAQGSPRVETIAFHLASTGLLPLAAKSEHPTVRVLGSREGLVGRRTANGHEIKERDEFAALPSRRVLNSQGKKDYQVKISYKGKEATVPIWDVGPWNTRDNYWDEKRDLFGDLPRFQPQAFAAWAYDYNGGRDQFNRWVSFPASIDIADGTFIEKLGMQRSDWVDVTFLWVDAPSPPPVELPTFSGLKPEPGGQEDSDEETWYFAEGNSQAPFETSFLIQNLSDQPAKAKLQLMAKDGSVKRHEVTLKEQGSARVSASELMPNAEFSARIEGTRPIAVERLTQFGKDGHAVTGVADPRQVWYLADVSTQPPFDSWLLLQNPGSAPAGVQLQLFGSGGGRRSLELEMPPTSRRSVWLNEYFPDASFALRVSADQPIVAERSVYLSQGGGHSALAAGEPAESWYLAGGSTRPGYDTWLAILNPGRRDASVKLTYLLEGDKPVEQSVTVEAGSRRTVRANDLVGGAHFGLQAEASQPIVVERAIFFGGSADGQGTSASAELAAPKLSKTWSLPNASTSGGVSSYILIANPNDEEAEVKLEFTEPDGKSFTRQYEVDAERRLTIDVAAERPDATLSVRVRADRPVVVEAASFFQDGAAGGKSVLGVPR